MLLEKENGLQIAGRFRSGEDLISNASTLLFDVLLLDLHLPGIDGMETARQLKELKHPGKIIILTMQRGGRNLSKLDKLNISGYVLKNTTVEELVQAIETVHNGNTWISKDISEYRHDSDLELKSSVIMNERPENILSDREREVLIMVCSELSSSQIAERLHISVGTVDTHRRNILVKLGVNNTVGLVKYALRNGLLE